jgi:hypothetical protein
MDSFSISLVSVLYDLGSVLPLLSIPIEHALRYSTAPLKWVRYCGGAVLGPEGRLVMLNPGGKEIDGMLSSASGSIVRTVLSERKPKQNMKQRLVNLRKPTSVRLDKVNNWKQGVGHFPGDNNPADAEIPFNQKLVV